MTININDVKIPIDFTESVPNVKKLNRARQYFIENGTLDKPIVVTKDMELVDGYIRYLVLKGYEVERTSCFKYYKAKQSPIVMYIYGKHPHQISDKEYVWRVPQSDKWNDFRENIEVGEQIQCYTKYGIKPVVITKTIKSDCRPMDIDSKLKIKRVAKMQHGYIMVNIDKDNVGKFHDYIMSKMN